VVSARSNGGYIGEDGRVKFARQQLVGAVFPSPMQVGAGVDTRHRRRGHRWADSRYMMVERRESVNPGSRSMAVVSPSLTSYESLKGSSIHLYGMTYSRNNPRRSS